MLERDDYVYLLPSILAPYTKAARKWWASYKEEAFIDTIVLPMKDAPLGMFVKFVRSAKQSCVRGLQAYPILAPAYLQNLPRVTGGAMATIEYLAKKGLVIDEFTLLPRRGLPTTLRNGFFLCYIPTVMLEHPPDALYIYVDREELIDLSLGLVPDTLKNRVRKYV